MRIRSTVFIARVLFTVALILAPVRATATDLYVKGVFGTAFGTMTPRGEFNIDTPSVTDRNFEFVGDDDDSSWLAGAGLGAEVPLPHVLPWDLSLPDWKMRFESEVLGGLEFDGKTWIDDVVDGDRFNEPFFHTVESIVWMNSFWLDMPVYRPVAVLFGPVEALKSMSFYAGGGVGLAHTKVKTRGPNSSSGSATDDVFAYQLGFGMSYALTPRVALSAGYRYRDLGKTKVSMDGNGLDVNDPSQFKLELESHGVDLGLRVKFYSVDFPKSLWNAMLR